VKKFLAGTSATLLAYGQSSQGKTHTLMGTQLDPGILPRALVDIMKRLPSGKALWYEYVQLHNDMFKDLLSIYATKALVLEEGACGMHLPQLTRRKAKSEEDILTAVASAVKGRAPASHAVLALRLVEEAATPEEAPSPTLFVVDLACSDRVVQAELVSGEQFAAACSRREALTAIGRVLSSLLDAGLSQDAEPVPYDASPLTGLLRDGLQADSRVAVMACAAQADAMFEESKDTVLFASRVSHAKDKVARKEAKDRRGSKESALTQAEPTAEGEAELAEN